MDLATARHVITDALERLRVAYYRPVFDEWGIIAIGPAHGGIVAYGGFRAAEFLENFQNDVAPLRQALETGALGTGELAVAAEARDTHHDAALKIGKGSFLILNNTTKRMAEIRTDPRWEHAEAVLLDLAEKFRSDPLDGF